MNFIGIIPARYASSRFPGKPLALICGKPMIQWVYEQSRKELERVVVATDDERIFDCVTRFGGEAVMTSSNHTTGTERIAEAVKLLPGCYDVVINIQGDEPFIQPEQINALKQCFTHQDVDIATLIRPFPPTTNYEQLSQPNTPKVTVNQQGRALLFSRSVIPFLRDKAKDSWAQYNIYYAHIGIYAYRTNVLQEITKLGRTPLEIAESLEQLRWLENGYTIQTAITYSVSHGIDTPDDLADANSHFDEWFHQKMM
ncbi:MAG: 3-deoxy-manno-octulosonate cytidylyltransferase [Bacteroidales bacterium]|nr:3-deoxy-manno-octulosonate cytidylyltransferase [Bacteroidales bacterium]